MNALKALFPEEDYRFHLGLRQGGVEEFFRPRDPTGRLLHERRHWLTTIPGRHAQLRSAAPFCTPFWRNKTGRDGVDNPDRTVAYSAGSSGAR